MSTKTKGILSYLLIAFGGAWTIWILLWLLGASPSRTSLQFQLLSLPVEFAPAIAAVIVRLWVTRERWTDAGLRLHLRKQWPYYLFAWVMPLFVMGVNVALATALKVGQADFSLQEALRLLYPGLVLTPTILAGVLLSPLLLAFIQTPLLWGEEFGWRGYLQLRLLSQRPLVAAVTTALSLVINTPVVWNTRHVLLWFHHRFIIIAHIGDRAPLTARALIHTDALSMP
jgi:hypothetical protein